MKLTKTEAELLGQVRAANERGALAGLSWSPSFPEGASAEVRFIKRLQASGAIVYVRAAALGAGWALPEFVKGLGASMTADPEVGDRVRVRLPDGSIVWATIKGYGLGGFLGLVDGEACGRRITRSMLVEPSSV